MEFFSNAVNLVSTIVMAIGGGYAAWGGINLMEGYGNDNAASNAYVP